MLELHDGSGVFICTIRFRYPPERVIASWFVRDMLGRDIAFDLPRSRGAVSAWGSLTTFQHGAAAVPPTRPCGSATLTSAPTAEEPLPELRHEPSVKQQADLGSLATPAPCQIYANLSRDAAAGPTILTEQRLP